jgi:hypothetical protein
MQWGLTLAKIWFGCSLAVILIFVAWAIFQIIASKESGPFRQKAGRLFKGSILVFLLATCIWPIALVWLINGAKDALRASKAPKWAKLGPNEKFSRTWTLADGRELTGIVGIDSPEIRVDWPHEGQIFYRSQMIELESGLWTEWTELQRMTLSELTEEVEEEDEIEEPRPFLAKPQMKSGKYIVELKLLASAGEPRVFSDLTMIVVT